MTNAIDETPSVSMNEVSFARLHGLACWDCGAVSRSLEPSHTVRQPGCHDVRTVSRCAECRQVAS